VVLTECLEAETAWRCEAVGSPDVDCIIDEPPSAREEERRTEERPPSRICDSLFDETFWVAEADTLPPSPVLGVCTSLGRLRV